MTDIARSAPGSRRVPLTASIRAVRSRHCLGSRAPSHHHCTALLRLQPSTAPAKTPKPEADETPPPLLPPPSTPAPFSIKNTHTAASMGRGRPRKRRLRSRGHDDVHVLAARDDDPAALFPVGAQVEVRSDDPGFVASYYEATVEGYQHQQHSHLSYVVAYSTLNSRDGGDSPLREVAAAANVRPRPPHRPPPRRGFAVHDMVDALHNGGWWAGVVVCAVPPEEAADTAHRPGCSRVYKVCFPTSRELLDFEETALRPSRVFEDDCWVPAAAAAKAKNGTPLFREGSQVEVSRSTNTFGKYWSPATVLKVIGASSFLVQYKDVKEDGELVTEILDSQYIRPTRDMVRMNSKYRFAPSSPAEVFHEGSWWPSVILEVLDIESTKKYVVKIKSQEADNDDAECTDLLLTVDHTQLRPRYDWYHGKWVRCLSEKPVSKVLQSTPQKRPASAVLAMASCNDSVDIANLAPCIDDDSVSRESGSHLMEKVNKDVVSEQFCPDLVSNEKDLTKHKASICPEKVVKQQGTLLSFEPQLPTSTKRKKSSYPEEVVTQQGTMLSFESHLTFSSLLSATGFGSLNYDPKLYLSDELERFSSQMVTKPSAQQTAQLQASLFGSFGTLRSLPLPQTPSFITPPHTIEFGSVVGSNKALGYQEKQSTDGCCDGITGINQNTNGSFSAFKDFAVHEGHGISKQDQTSAMIRYAAEGSQFIENSKQDQTSTMIRYAAEGSQFIENSEITHLTSISPGNSSEAQPDDTLITPKSAMVRYAAEGGQSTVNSEITQFSSTGTSNSEAQPGDTVIAPKCAEGTPMSKFVPSRTQGSNDSLLQRSRNVQESIIAERHSGSSSSDVEEIPFVKTSPLWAQIEAMEVFRKVPQRPKFDKCQQHVPELREGMALGLMLSFANLAESIKRLCIEDDVALFEEKMKGVSLLEADGFEVEHLRSRLKTLLCIKKGRAQLQGAIKDLEKKFSDEETQRHAQMGVLNMAVRQLDLQARLFRHIMQSAISQELSDASEIWKLKAEASKLEQGFSSATASPW